MTNGIHHITAIASDPQQTYDFYTKILGLRFVKKSVNQDDTQTYHLFFGDKIGSPGMDLTFFTFQPPYPGKRGVGLITNITLAVPQGSLDFWKLRFQTNNITHTPIKNLFDLKTITFYDPDNQQLQLIEIPQKSLSTDQSNLWTTPEIKLQHAIHYFHSATLTVSNVALIRPILYKLGYNQIRAETNLYLFQVGTNQRAAFLLVDESPLQEPGINANGTVHHIAFAVKNLQEQQELRIQLIKLGLHPTEVIDRYYFKSVYFRTPAGILFEIATQGPGFTTDESQSQLGTTLALPPFLEHQRKEIESQLQPLHTDNQN